MIRYGDVIGDEVRRMKSPVSPAAAAAGWFGQVPGAGVDGRGVVRAVVRAR